MWEIFKWSAAIASLVGTVLNLKKRQSCFYIWACTNLAWIVVDIQAKLWSQAVLFLVSFFLAIYGIYEWRKSRRRDNSHRPEVRRVRELRLVVSSDLKFGR